jgi:hypothetical protein
MVMISAMAAEWVGLTIPALKAIAQWNTLRRVDFDCFGHFHTVFDGNSFVSNGSMRCF